MTDITNNDRALPDSAELNALIEKEENARKERIRPFMDRRAVAARPNNYRDLMSHNKRKYSNLHFTLSQSEIPPGLRYGRFRVYEGNVFSAKLVADLYRRGWSAVPATRHPSMAIPDLGSLTSSMPRDYIIIGDAMIMQRPIEDHIADMEDFQKAARNKTAYANQAALNNGTQIENHRQIKTSLNNHLSHSIGN